MAPAIALGDEVRAAIADRRPVVALESTLVAHGLPWPENFAVGRALEDEVRQHGAVPATVAVVRGRLTVGIDAATLERMARGGEGGQAPWLKTGVADLGPLVARGGDGATTVSATTFAAARAGLRVFATGGIGGVHRGDGMDVSSDLGTLAREPVAVVSAGCKAILDLPRTLEALETLGVLVLGVRTDEFPAFYTRTSGLGLMLEHRVDSAEDAARVLHAHWSLQRSGVLLANPIPKAHELDRATIDAAIAQALDDAARLGLRGKALTPHLLSFVARATHKRSLAANRALAIHNAAFAADVASALAALPPLP
ncbi:MAG TPA: pseudouridine-5'-phosphate glycosidase [Polyangia bacterium]|nr:pseudouridine-5'-phosphate glycosidase [Polyangia bacterium]